ncbi:hypothetical protein CLG94_10750 [Candidatus Methylomirabilis limnetica]|jgi:hypothetical protein|uniref:Uncharacterized protein n=1 Tax=Candidatus Methylomirabilis limnetica TaxID=2033718 RepID=A0A2T4TVN4_9BACT|nr:hypothetical protein [Candidatus Methylomirabilis limnetica]PTL35176.1 hypothetical protein CLG94_10750 [Candidatus Methylomirabilis limnetica]
MIRVQYRHISSLSYLLSHVTVKKNSSNLYDGRLASASSAQNDGLATLTLRDQRLILSYTAGPNQLEPMSVTSEGVLLSVVFW